MQSVDCLLVGYRGVSYDLINSKIRSKKIGSLTVEKVFNGTVSYLGTYLHRRGFSFDYINYYEDDFEELKSKLLKGNIRAVGFSTSHFTSVEALHECVSQIRSLDLKVKIILGGTFIAKLIGDSREGKPQEIKMVLRYINADFYINSFQGETALCNILRALKDELPLDQIPNIYFKQQGRYVYTKTDPEDNEMEDNTVDWSLFADRVGKVVSVRTSISCPFSCAYCAFPVNAGRYRYISVDAIEKELDAINRIEKVQSVSFIDDTLNVPIDRFKDLLRMMIRKKYRFKWHAYLRCQFLDSETVELIKKSGCEGVLLGIESGSQKMLDNMNKKVTVEALKRGLNLLRKFDIVTVGMFFVGFPGETDDTVKETIEFINNEGLTFYEIQPWYYDSRTPISKDKEKYGINGAHFEWSHETMDFARAKVLVDEVVASVKNPSFCIDCETVFQCMRVGERIVDELELGKTMLKAKTEQVV